MYPSYRILRALELPQILLRLADNFPMIMPL